VATLKEIFLISEEEKVAKLTPSNIQWTLDEKDGKHLLDIYISKGMKYFKFEPGSQGGFFNKTQKSGSGFQIKSGEKLPLISKFVAINLEDKLFEINTNLQDPRVFTIISTTIKAYPEFNNFNIVKFIYNEDEDKYEILNFGIIKNLLSSSKKIASKSPAYGGDRFEEFELEVFKEISEDNWYHATTKKNLDSIMKDKVLRPSGDKQGEGWTQLNFNLQKAVYLTKNKKYAYQIANTLSDRFEQDACVIEINGSVLKKDNYSNIVVDEDSLRDDYDGSIHYFVTDEDFMDPILSKRFPQFISSVTDKIESIGFKGNISTNEIVDVDIVSYEPEVNNDF
jgi:hypothetical protein